MTTGINHPVTGSPAPYRFGAAVTPHDSNELAIYARALYIGVGGDVKVTTIDGSVVVIKAVAGLLPITAKVVWSAGTAATNIVALW